MKAITHADHPNLVHLISGYLAAHGIRTTVAGDALISGGHLVPSLMRPTVYVHEEDEERARELLAAFAADYEQNRIAGGYWTCPACGDFLAETVTECPDCGDVRPPEKSRMPRV